MWKQLRSRPFRLYWLGATISATGDRFSIVALPLVILDLALETKALGGVLAAAAIPRVALMLVGGVLCDRLGAGRLIVWGSLVQALLAAGVFALLTAGRMELWQLYVYSALSGAASAFTIPARVAFVPELVPREDIRSATSLLLSSYSIVQFVGPLIAGVMIAVLGLPMAFLVDGVTFALLAFMVLPAPTASHQAKASLARATAAPPLQSSVRDAFDALRGDMGTTSYIVATTLFYLTWSGAFIVGVPAYAHLELHASDVTLGMFIGAQGLGYLVGGSLDRALRGQPSYRIYALAMLVTGLASLLVGVLVTSTVATTILLALGGISSAIVRIIAFSEVQMRPAARVRGRLNALLSFGMFGSQAISLWLGGLVASAFRPAALMAWSGALVAVLGALCLSLRIWMQAPAPAA